MNSSCHILSSMNPMVSLLFFFLPTPSWLMYFMEDSFKLAYELSLHTFISDFLYFWIFIIYFIFVFLILFIRWLPQSSLPKVNIFNFKSLLLSSIILQASAPNSRLHTQWKSYMNNILTGFLMDPRWMLEVKVISIFNWNFSIDILRHGI